MIGFSENITDRNFINQDGPRLDKAMLLQKIRLLTEKSATIELQYSTLVLLLHYLYTNTSFDFTENEYSDIFFTLTRVFQPYGPDGSSGSTQALSPQQWSVQRLALNCLDFLSSKTKSSFFITSSLTRLVDQHFVGLEPQSVRLLGKIALEASFSEIQKLLRMRFTSAINENDDLLVSSSAVACEIYNERKNTATTISLQDQAISALQQGSSLLTDNVSIASGHIIASLGIDRICERAEKIVALDNPYAPLAAVKELHKRLKTIFNNATSPSQVDTSEVFRIVDVIAYFLPKISSADNTEKKDVKKIVARSFSDMAAPIEAMHAFLYFIKVTMKTKLVSQLIIQRGIDVPRIVLHAITSFLKDYCRTSCATMVGIKLAAEFTRVVLKNPNSSFASTSTLGIDEIIMFINQVRTVVISFPISNYNEKNPITAIQQECLATASEIVKFADTTFVFSNEMNEAEFDILVKDIKLIMTILLIIRYVDKEHRARFKNVIEKICLMPYPCFLGPLIPLLVNLLNDTNSNDIKQTAFDILATIAIVDVNEETGALSEIISHFDDCTENGTIKRICELIGNHYNSLSTKGQFIELKSEKTIKFSKIIAALWNKAKLGTEEVQLACSIALKKLRPIVINIPQLQNDIDVILDTLKKNYINDVEDNDIIFGVVGIDAIIETSINLIGQPKGGADEIKTVPNKILTLLKTLPTEIPNEEGDLFDQAKSPSIRAAASSRALAKEETEAENSGKFIVNDSKKVSKMAVDIIRDTVLPSIINNSKIASKYPEIVEASKSCGSEFVEKEVIVFCADDEYNNIESGDYEMEIKAYKVFFIINGIVYLTMIYSINNNEAELPMYNVKLTTFILYNETKSKVKNIKTNEHNVYASEPIKLTDMKENNEKIIPSVLCNLETDNEEESSLCHIGTVMKFSITDDDDSEVETVKLEEINIKPEDFIVSAQSSRIDYTKSERYTFILHDMKNEMDVIERLPSVLKMYRKKGTGKFGDNSVELTGVICGLGFVKVIATTELQTSGEIKLIVDISLENLKEKEKLEQISSLSNFIEYMLH